MTIFTIMPFPHTLKIVVDVSLTSQPKWQITYFDKTSLATYLKICYFDANTSDNSDLGRDEISEDVFLVDYDVTNESDLLQHTHRAQRLTEKRKEALGFRNKDIATHSICNY